MGVIETARQYLGTPYVLGGPLGRIAGNATACDCSGFVAAVFAQQGIILPAFTDALYAQTVSVDTPAPGDLIFYGPYADLAQPGVTWPHVEIFEGRDMAIGCKWPEGASEHPILSLPHEFRRVPGLASSSQPNNAAVIILISALGLLWLLRAT